MFDSDLDDEVDRLVAAGVVIDPTEQAEYDDFAARWTAINAEGEQRNWLHWTGHESGPQLHSPWEKENKRHSEEIAAVYAKRRRAAETLEAKKAKQLQDGVARVVARIYGDGR